jgi:hypothetical protein
VPTPNGGKWHAAQVIRIRARLKWELAERGHVARSGLPYPSSAIASMLQS